MRLLILLILLPLFGLAQYTPSLHTPMNKPIGIAQAVPTDARSYYYDANTFTYRPYASTSEVLAYLNTSVKRSGHFFIYVNVGGSVKTYMFRNGTLDANLVEAVIFGSGIDSTFYSYNGTLNSNRTVNLNTNTLTFTNGSTSTTPTKFDKGVMMATSSGNVYVGTNSDTNFNYGSTVGTTYIPRLNVNGKSRFNGDMVISHAGTSIPASSNYLYLLGRSGDASGTTAWSRMWTEGYGTDVNGTGAAFTLGTSGFLRFAPNVASIQFSNGNYFMTWGSGGMVFGNNSYTAGFTIKNGFKQTSGNAFTLQSSSSVSQYNKMFVSWDNRFKILCDTSSQNAALSNFAAFDIESSTKGLLIPRLTTTAKNSLGIGAPKGLIVYDTTANALYTYNGSAWVSAGGGGSGVTTGQVTPPSTTAWTNVSSLSTSASYNYNNYGSSVEYWGEITMTTSSAATLTSFAFVPSVSPGALAASFEASGSFVSNDGTSGRIYYDNANSRVVFSCTPSTTTSRTYSFRFIYRIAAL